MSGITAQALVGLVGIHPSSLAGRQGQDLSANTQHQ